MVRLIGPFHANLTHISPATGTIKHVSQVPILLIEADHLGMQEPLHVEADANETRVPQNTCF
jgi:hypothetical protein